MMNSRREVWPLPIRLVLPIALGLIGCIAAQANGQLGGASYPGTGYRLTMPSFYEGEYGDALDGFRSAARSGLRSSQGRWVDSVCYHTMMGECFYHMGQLPQALEQYTVSLNLFMVNKDFLQRVKFAAVPIPKRRPIRPTITWGTTTRVSEPGDYSDSMPTMFGNFNAEQALQQGGIVAPPEFRNVDVVEILRCTALAMSRRRELLGPACQHDPLTTTLLAALGNRPGPVNHWSQTWVTVLLGMAEASAGHAPEAAALLQSSLVIGGRFDHPLTGLALLELGRLSYEQGQHAAALVLFLEASYAAAEYQQPDVMDEALRLGLASFLANGGNGAFPPLAPAAVWATRVKYRQLQASLLTSVAENLVAMRDAAGATRAIAAARQSMARSPMAVGEVGARLHFQNAINNFQLGNAAPGNASLTNAMTFQRHASRWLFHIVVADQLVTGGAITTHTADELYEFLLREPTTSDWTTNTWEALAVTLVPHVLPYEHWLEIAASRRDADRCLEIADALRRHRFYSSLPAGGRLLALRWLLENPFSAGEPQLAVIRQDILARYPGYTELSARVAAARRELAALPIANAAEEVMQRQHQLSSQIDEWTTAQEVILHEIAVRREPSPFQFPPLRTMAEVRKRLPESTIALVFVTTSTSSYGFLLDQKDYAMWEVKANPSLRKQAVSFFRELGLKDANAVINPSSLEEHKWQDYAQELFSGLLPHTQHGFWKRFDELVVVPDGWLWYFPFEAVPVAGEDDNMAPLVAQVRIRYAPTVSLIVPDDRPIQALPKTVVIAGSLMGREDENVVLQRATEISDAIPGSDVLPNSLPGPSGLLRSTWDRLIVLRNINDTARVPYGWSPAAIDSGQAGADLGRWITLPWGGPQQVVLPGFHTAAERAMGRGADGYEVFGTVCGLMATGARTILLGRWNTGGQTTVDMVREFSQELPHTSAAAAWSRSVTLVRNGELNPDLEPRLKKTTITAMRKADHPFFWAGQMLIDTGVEPNQEVAEPKPPAEMDGAPMPVAPGEPPAANDGEAAVGLDDGARQ